MVDTTAKEYQDKQKQKALRKRDANVNKNKRDHRKLMKDAHKKAYDKTLEIIDN